VRSLEIRAGRVIAGARLRKKPFSVLSLPFGPACGGAGRGAGDPLLRMPLPVIASCRRADPGVQVDTHSSIAAGKTVFLTTSSATRKPYFCESKAGPNRASQVMVRPRWHKRI